MNYLKKSGKSSLCMISHTDWNDMKNRAIKEWHFERSGKGVKPVEGKYDKDNPKHIKISDVIRIWDDGHEWRLCE